jgi:amidohydrolase
VSQYDFVRKLKEQIIAAVSCQREAALQISHEIHSNPELGFQETRASTLLCEYLDTHGFRITRGIAGLPTAFQADYGSEVPAIGLMAEYDALPEIGHGCGHNLIAAGSTVAAVSAKAVVNAHGGRISLFGTPGEEGGGGKILMAKAGVFNDLDAAMMVHPGMRDIACPEVLAARTVKVEFFGNAAHASVNPEKGINALDALLFTFNAISSLRQHIPDAARIHGIITDGGHAPNIIPAYSAAVLMVRAPDNGYLEELSARLIDCCEAGAKASGARLKYEWIEHCYAALVHNRTLAGIFQKNMEMLGRDYVLEARGERFGSTDMGNISLQVPSIHPLVAIAPPGSAIHSPLFCQAAISSSAERGLMDAATALALTTTDLIVFPEKLAAVKAEFASIRDK